MDAATLSGCQQKRKRSVAGTVCEKQVDLLAHTQTAYFEPQKSVATDSEIEWLRSMSMSAGTNGVATNRTISGKLISWLLSDRVAVTPPFRWLGASGCPNSWWHRISRE